MKNKRTQYYIEPRSGPVYAAAAFLGISMILRLAWYAIWPEAAQGSLVWTRVALPVGACGLFLLCLFRWGRERLWLSFFPAFLGVLFFILKAADFVWWHRMLCTLLYLAVAVLYGLTVFGLAPIRKLLIPLFGLPLLFHIFVEDLLIKRSVYTPDQWIQEGSVLCIMAALLCISVGMREKK